MGDILIYDTGWRLFLDERCALVDIENQTGYTQFQPRPVGPTSPGKLELIHESKPWLYSD